MSSKIIKENCSYCGKVAEETSSFSFDGDTFIKLKCKHTIIASAIKGNDYNLTSTDGRSLFEFQKESIQFIEESGGRALIAHEMGLGKTVIANGFLKLHPECLPALAVVKSSLKLQWFGEFIRWTGYLPLVVGNSKTPLLPGFQVYIITYDLLRRIDREKIKQLGIKTLILDECQQIKNHLSARAKNVQDIAGVTHNADGEIVNKGIENVIALSGTPIKNNAGEYFTILNLLKPTRFPYYDRFIKSYCDAYDTGWATKVGGLHNAAMFHEETKDFIIRKTRAEVLPDLPSISRNFHHVELDAKFEKAYKQAQDEFEDWFYKESKSLDEMSIIEKITKLRHIVGWNKVEPTVEFATDFLMDTEPTRKLTIFTHHLDVTSVLENNLNKWIKENLPHIKMCKISAEQSMDARHLAVSQFENDDNMRICIASTLAAGEGLNLQFCTDIILMERQWNPANEEQVEGRIVRIGVDKALKKFGINKLTATYMVASGTIDEFFTELVEQKRTLVAAAMDNKEIEWSQSSLMKELAEAIATRGGKKWRLS